MDQFCWSKTMRAIILIQACVFSSHAVVSQARATELGANQTAYEQDSIERSGNQVMNKLVERVQNSMDKLADNSDNMELRHEELDDTTLGKPGQLLAPRMPSLLAAPVSRTSQLSMAPLPATAHRAQRRDLHTTKATSRPEQLQKYVDMFKFVPEPTMRYKQLLFYANKLDAMNPEDKKDENKVIGCQSQVWVVPRMEDGKVYFSGDSDAALTKGLAYLLVTGLSGSPPAEIMTLEPDFIAEMQLKQSLTESRSNGFLNMLRHMQKKTYYLFQKENPEGAAAALAEAAARAKASAESGNG